MASAVLHPLDDAFVARLRASIDAAAQLSAEAHTHWQGLLNHFAGRSNFEITAYIAQNFNNNIWTGNEPWFLHPVIQEVFRGYDRNAFDASNVPLLDDVARSQYNPSNTIGRGNLFPGIARPLPHEAVLNREQFDALPPAERQNYQLTGVFGGHRFQRVPGARQPVRVAPGGTASNTSGVGVTPFGVPITGTPVTNVAGTQGINPFAPTPVPTGLNPTAPGPTNPFLTPPGSNPAGTGSTPGTSQPGATSGGPGSLPGSNTGIPPAPPVVPTGVGGSVIYPDLINIRYDLVLPLSDPNAPTTTAGTPPTGPTVVNVPVTPGITTVSGGNTTGTGGTTSWTGGTTSGTAGTTPGTAGPKPPGTLPPAPGTLPPAPGTLPSAPGISQPAPGTLPPAPGISQPAPGTLPPAPGTLPWAPGISQPAIGTLPPAPTGVSSGAQPGSGTRTPAGPGFLPNTPGSSSGVPTLPSQGTGFLPGTTGGGLPGPPGGLGGLGPAGTQTPAPGSGLQPVTPLPPLGGSGLLPTSGSTSGPPRPPAGIGAAPGGGSFQPPTDPGFLPVAPGGTPGAFPADGSVPAPLQPSAADMLHSFTWRGQVQPPVGSRLRAAQILLDEGDIDREMHWERNVAEVHEFLNWLLSCDEAPRIGPESRHMAEQLLEKVQAHNLFNDTHYGPNTPNKVVTSDMIPARKPRLKYNGKLPLVLGRDHNDRNHLLPWEFPTHPRAETVVNDMWLTDAEQQLTPITEERRSTKQDRLSHDEEAWWQAAGQVPADNAALVQEQYFEQCIASDGIGFQGWVESRLVDDGKRLSRRLFNGDELGAGKLCYAKERACRRAGLQAALRQFSSNENTVANTPWRRVRLALSADEVGVMRNNTGAGPTRKYELAKLRPDQLEKTDGKNDPQGFTANMTKFWADQSRDMASAREAVVSRLGFGLPSMSTPARLGQPPAVLPPMSLWGAYVDSGLSAVDEYHRQMLREMSTAKKLFDREKNIAPRHLLTQMDDVYKQGLTGAANPTYIPAGQQQSVAIQFHRGRDLDEDGRSRDLDKMEIYWIRFLLTQSITPEMTHQLEPRASMFILFADKLARIFNDVSDPLFPDNDKRVSVEDLLDYIHDKTDGPVMRIKFYPHDVQMWLERLHSQGRCRYQEDWRCYGWVQRPIPTCHPEQLVRWTVPENDRDLRPLERSEDVVFAPRFDRLRTWHSLVRRCLHNNRLDHRVEQYFISLAYRWGHYTGKLTTFDGGLEQKWKNKDPRQAGDMSNAIRAYKAEFNRITQWEDVPNNPLVRLVKATLPDKANDNDLTVETSLQLVRDHIIKEAVKKDSMLWPGRSADNYLDPDDEKVRPKIWSWAKPEVRGTVKRFFSVNRWPVQVQTERRQGIITRDEDINEDMLWKPEIEDPTPSKYYRPKARPYIDEKVEFRSGHRNFLIGDTPRQKQHVIDRMFAQMGRAMTAGDLNRNNGQDQDIPAPTMKERFQTWSDYLWDRYNNIVDDDDDDEDRYEEPGSRLRKFDRDQIPVSFDPRKRDADGDAANQGNPKRPRHHGPDDSPQGSPVPGAAPAAAAAAAAPVAAGAAADAGAANQDVGNMEWLRNLAQLGSL